MTGKWSQVIQERNGNIRFLYLMNLFKCSILPSVKFLMVLQTILFFSHCSAPDKKNDCDTGSNSIQKNFAFDYLLSKESVNNVLLLKYLFPDQLSYCALAEGNAPSNLIYSESPFSFLVSNQVSVKTPMANGKIRKCSSSPSLPAGLTLSQETCAISGIPTTAQENQTYKITATNLLGETNTLIQIRVLTNNEITSYSIPSLGITGIISGSTISLSSDTLTNIGSYIARFTTTGITVKIGNTVQISDTSSNSYSSNLVYTVTGEDGSTRDFTVTFTAPRSYGSSSLKIWLKADALALNDNDPVPSWTDLSANGNNFSQSTSSARPTFKTNQINGYPAVQFRQATVQNLVISSGATDLYVNNSDSFFIVYKVIQTNVAGTTLLNLHGSNGREFALNHPNAEFLVCRNALACNQVSSLIFPTNTFIALGTIQNLNTTVNEIWNGDLKGTISAVGGNFDYSGAGSPGTAYLSNGNLDADIAEVLYYNSNLTQNEIDKIYCYLRTKYKLSSTTTSCGT